MSTNYQSGGDDSGNEEDGFDHVKKLEEQNVSNLWSFNSQGHYVMRSNNTLPHVLIALGLLLCLCPCICIPFLIVAYFLYDSTLLTLNDVNYSIEIEYTNGKKVSIPYDQVIDFVTIAAQGVRINGEQGAYVQVCTRSSNINVTLFGPMQMTEAGKRVRALKQAMATHLV